MNVNKLIDYYGLERFESENCYLRNTYRSTFDAKTDVPMSTSMIGLYCNEPKSCSMFHVLSHDETWYFQGGDPIRLMLLCVDGTSKEVILGSDIEKNQVLQYTIHANTYQAGCLVEGGTYALFGCSVTPGFTMECFKQGTKNQLMKQYPDRKEWIEAFGMDE